MANKKLPYIKPVMAFITGISLVHFELQTIIAVLSYIAAGIWFLISGLTFLADAHNDTIPAKQTMQKLYLTIVVAALFVMTGVCVQYTPRNVAMVVTTIFISCFTIIDILYIHIKNS